MNVRSSFLKVLLRRKVRIVCKGLFSRDRRFRFRDQKLGLLLIIVVFIRIKRGCLKSIYKTIIHKKRLRTMRLHSPKSNKLFRKKF